MTKDWVHEVGHSPVCQILLQIVVRAVITSPPPVWTSSAGMLSTPADFPFFNDYTAASTPLCPLALWFYSSEQYSVRRFSICRSSVRHFPERSWTVVAFPCFTVVKSFTSWYALLLLFFLRFSSISLHWSPIQPFSLMLMFCSLTCISQILRVRIIFFLSSLLLSNRLRISAMTHGFFFCR